MIPIPTAAEQGRFDEAARLHAAGKRDEALAAYLALIGDFPTDTILLRSLAGLYTERGEWAEAIEPLKRVLAFEPTHAGSWMVLGAAYGYVADYAAAGRAYDRAMALAPDMPALRWNRALWLLLQGRWEEGWEEYRWGLVHRGMRRLRTLKPEWSGEPLPGGTLWLWGEQGLGDALMFVRFAVEARALSGAARVVLEVHPTLLRLFAAQGWPFELVALQEDASMPGGCDEHASLMSLPRILGVNSPDELDGAAYLTAPAPEANGDLFRVGLCWAGNRAHTNDSRRSLSREEFAPIVAGPGVEFVSLQYGEDGFLPRDWCDTANVAASCDLIISVDTGVAHLGGALGVPTWMLCPAVTDFRWLLNRADSPWYGSMRLFRQEKSGEWAPVVERVARGLSLMVRTVRPAAIDDEGERGWSGAVPKDVQCPICGKLQPGTSPDGVYDCRSCRHAFVPDGGHPAGVNGSGVVEMPYPQPLPVRG